MTALRRCGTAASSVLAGVRSRPYKSKARSVHGAPKGLCLPLEKKLGQHLLKNPGVLDKIVAASELKSTDTVLEIGPGQF